MIRKVVIFVTYKLLKRMIERKNYESIADIKDKIGVFYLRSMLTEVEMDELLDMLEEQE